jgi:hypothetical protein
VGGHIRGRASDLGQGARQLAPSCPLARLGHGGVGNLGAKLGFEFGRIVEKTPQRRLLGYKPRLFGQLAQVGG